MTRQPAQSRGLRQARPLSEAPTQTLRSLHGVMTDIDDTLTRDGQIEPQALQALHTLHAAGLPVIAITGRPLGWSEPFAREWPLAALVAEISHASSEQATGMGQVNEAVSQLDSLTQQNAAMAEQATAASVSLAGNAQEMLAMVKQFRTASDRAPVSAVEVRGQRVARTGR